MPNHRRQMTYSRKSSYAARSAHARGAREFRTYDTSYIRPRKSKAPVVVSAVVTIAIIAAAIFGISSFLKGCSGEADLLPADQQAVIVVEQGAGAGDIGVSLVDAKLIAKASDFSSRVEELGVASDLKPGTYTFYGQTSIDDIIVALEIGPEMGPAVTIPEGYKLTDIAAAVEKASEGRISADAFMAAASDASVYAADYAFLAEVGTNSLEGFLFPKTYSVAENATADSLIRAMLDQFQKEFNTLDFSYPQSVGLSVYDAVKLASVVEKESTGSDEIRAQVAGVFYNRILNVTGETAGFLQSDATTAYSVGHNPTPEEVHDANDPYSTYAYKGLPPTPICSPGLACLKAVCAPAATDAYYFYFWNGSDGKLQYAFTNTYEEHQQAILANS